MKSVMLSIKPRYCEMIASGQKTIEVRKTRPKIETPFKCYIYCTKEFYRKGNGYFQGKYCAKVIGEFVCDAIIVDKTFGHDDLFNAAACLSVAEVAAYCINKETFGWHISDLVIYDEPKELSAFRRIGALSCDNWLYGLYNGSETYKDYLARFELKRPPQSWCYVEEIK